MARRKVDVLSARTEKERRAYEDARRYWCRSCEYEQIVDDDCVPVCGDCGGRLDHRPGPEGTAAPSVLDEAAGIVHGARQAAYGHPRDNHACTAELWSAYLRRRFTGDENWDYSLPISAFDVCMLNILQKVSRLAHSRTRDSLVDIAGFAQNADMVDE